jgi:hypothetical protein
MSAPVRTVGKAVGKRVTGRKPGALEALAAATVVGFSAAVATYRALRK